MRGIDRRHLLPGAAAFAAALLVALLGFNAGAEPPAAAASGTVELQLLGVNDLHGHLEPPQPGVGGAAWLGAWLDRAAASHPERTIRVHAGDMVGASPLISSHFRDEPTIEATNRMGFDVGTLGNHEFDEGGAEALRLVRRAALSVHRGQHRHARRRRADPAALQDRRARGREGRVHRRHHHRHALLPALRVRAPVPLDRPLRRRQPLRAGAARQGVEAIVVLAHAGAFQEGADAAGEVVDEAREMDDAVDVVVAGHTHSRLNLEVDGKLVVEALSYGVAFDRVRIAVDRASGDVVSKSAPGDAHAATRASSPTPSSPRWSRATATASRRWPTGWSATPQRRLDNAAVDRLAVDAQRAFAGADIAFLNPGNTRAELDAGPITYAEAFEVQAYEHPVWRLRMRGSDLLAAMAEQPGLLVSGPRDLRPELVYTVAANGIVAGRAPFDRGTDRERVGTDLEALVAWLAR